MEQQTDDKTEFSFSELSPRAKARARERWCIQQTEDFDGEQVLEDAETVAGILGIDVTRDTVRVAGGRNSPARTYQQRAIYFSGFCSRGDGACFEGRYTFRPEARAEIRAHAPQDTELHRISDELHLLSAPERMTFMGGAVTLAGQEWLIGQQPSPALCARIWHEGHDYNPSHMRMEVCNDEAGEEVDEDDARPLRELMIDFANWIYARLQEEYDYLTSDEAAEQALEESDEVFDEDGEPV